jgi:hypothetical protein
VIAGRFKTWWSSLSVTERREAVRPTNEAIARRIKSARRAQLLSVYRLRAKWRKADLAKLTALGVKHGKYRMQRISKLASQRGRGVLADPTPLADRVELSKLLEPGMTPSQRRQILRATTWWSEFVEAAYRGEVEIELAKKRASRRRNDYGDSLLIDAAKTGRRLSKNALNTRRYPSINAAKTVGDAISLSYHRVFQFCEEANSGTGAGRFILAHSRPGKAGDSVKRFPGRLCDFFK